MLPIAKRKDSRVLVVEGGGMRGSFAGGVLAAMAQCYPVSNFDLVVGVSAGSCAAAYYVTETPGDMHTVLRNLRMWRFDLSGSRLINYVNGILGRTFLNQEYLVDHLFGLKYPLKRERLDHPKTIPLYVVLSNLHTLVPEYVRATADNVLNLLKAATAMPIATRGRRFFQNSEVTDGGVLDPLPVEAVMQAGYRDITVILNRPIHYRDNPIGAIASRLAFPGYKRVKQYLRKEHHIKYNRARDLVENPPPGIKMLAVSPDQVSIGLVSRSERKLNRTVELGLEAGYRAFASAKNDARSWVKRLFRRR